MYSIALGVFKHKYCLSNSLALCFHCLNFQWPFSNIIHKCEICVLSWSLLCSISIAVNGSRPESCDQHMTATSLCRITYDSPSFVSFLDVLCIHCYENAFLNSCHPLEILWIVGSYELTWMPGMWWIWLTIFMNNNRLPWLLSVQYSISHNSV